jgi:hypothetical protein
MNQHFASLVFGMTAQATQALDGQLPAGVPTGASRRDVAKALIDTVGRLEQKTRGNLDADELRLLTEALTNLRFRFVSSEKPVQ